MPIAFEDLGESEVKNDLRPLRVCRILPEGRAAAPQEARHRSARRSACCLSKFRRRPRDGILSRQRRRGFDYRIGARPLVLPSWLAIRASITTATQLIRSRSRGNSACGSRAACARRAAGPDQLPARRSGERPASLGRPFRRYSRRFFRSAGQDHRKRNRFGRLCCARPRSNPPGASPRRNKTLMICPCGPSLQLSPRPPRSPAAAQHRRLWRPEERSAPV